MPLGGSHVSRVQVLLMGKPTPVLEQAVSVAARARQDDIGPANLSTTLTGSCSFSVRATDDSRASSDSATITVLVNNTSTAPTQHPATSGITQVGSTPVSPGQAPVIVSGNVYLYFRRSGNTAVAAQSANIQANAIDDFFYTWNSRSVVSALAGSADHLCQSSRQKSGEIVNPATTSVISINMRN